MTTLASIAAEQRPAGALPRLPDPTSQGRIELIDSFADVLLDQRDTHSEHQLRTVHDLRNLKGTRAAMIQHAAEEGKQPHEASLAELDGQIARQERALQMAASAAPFIDAAPIALLRNRLIKFGRGLNGSARVWKGSVSKGASVQSLESTVRKLGVQLEAIERAPIPPAEAKAKLLGKLNVDADAGRPRVRFRVSDVYSGNRERRKFITTVDLDWPTEHHTIRPLDASPLPALHDIEMLDAKAMLIWLHRDQIAAEIERSVDAAYADYDGPVLTEAERRVEIKRIKESIRDVEFQIASLVWPMVEQGDHQALRHLVDLHPGAVLGLEG